MVDSKENDKWQMAVSEQLCTYPSLNSTTVKWWQVGVAVGLGDG